MAEITSDAVIGFAKQGHPQAIAVLLNRVLVPKGAHVKVRQKKELLKVLVNFLRDTELEQLVRQVQNTFSDLSPDNVQRVQIFTQRLGDKQASFQKEIVTSSSKSASHNEVQHSTSNSPQCEGQGISATDSSARPAVPVAGQSDRTAVSPHRYSVTEFLSQVSKVEELDVLKDHPFFTGVCPKCLHDYANFENPPLFWDCTVCGWQDDLSQKVPSHQLRETPQRHKIRQGKRLGSYLIEAGLLTPAQIEVALADQQLAGIRLGEVLVRRGWIKEETVEYFMRKVVEPERQGSTGQAEAYLESSRNLLKTLIHSQDQDEQNQQNEPDCSSGESDTIPGTYVQEDINEKAESAEKKQPISHRETLILSELELSSGSLREPTHSVNERETLLLPDVEMTQLIDSETDQ